MLLAVAATAAPVARVMPDQPAPAVRDALSGGEAVPVPVLGASGHDGGESPSKVN